MYITPQQPSRQITVTEKENKNFYLAEMSLLLQNACFLNKKNVNVQMIVVACGIFETFGWQEHFNPRANIIHMQSLFIFFFKEETEKATDLQLPCFTFVSKKRLPIQYFWQFFPIFRHVLK